MNCDLEHLRRCSHYSLFHFCALRLSNGADVKLFLKCFSVLFVLKRGFKKMLTQVVAGAFAWTLVCIQLQDLTFFNLSPTNEIKEYQMIYP